MTSPTEQMMKDVTSVYFGTIDVAIKRGVEIDDPGQHGDTSPCVLSGRLGASLQRPNPGLLQDKFEGVARILSRPPHPRLVQNNRWFHGLLGDGLEIEYRDAKGRETCGGALVQDVIALLSRTA